MLYLFLWQLMAVVWKDLRRPTAGDPTSPRGVARLVIVASGDTQLRVGHLFPLYGDATIGRGPDSTIILNDGFVSTNHAALTYRDGSWWLADLGSRNGSWVNDKRVRGEVQLEVGDTVTIGQVQMKLDR